MFWAWRYHLGSVAFGSFLIAVCQMIRFLFEYYRRQIGIAEKTKIVKILLCVTAYLLYMMEKCVKFITKNAYIQVALTNKMFCAAAWNGFILFVKNMGRFGSAKMIGTIYIGFGGLLLATCNMAIIYVILEMTEFTVVTSPIPPVLCVAVVTVLISYTFLSIFSFTTDAILQSFLLDEELRFHGNNRPEYIQEFADNVKNQGKGGCCCGLCC